MGVFNFIETFFFISLGITFILILLLVYHFKQRLSSVEQKGDTMFDIMNNMVKEMGVIKTLVLQRAMASVAPSSMPFPFPNMGQGQGQGQPINNIFSQMSNGPSNNELKPVLEDGEDEEDGEDDSSTSSSSLGDSDNENSDENSDDDSEDDVSLSKQYIGPISDDNIKVIVSDDDNTVDLEIIMQDTEPEPLFSQNINIVTIDQFVIPTLDIDESLTNNDDVNIIAINNTDTDVDDDDEDEDDKSVISELTLEKSLRISAVEMEKGVKNTELDVLPITEIILPITEPTIKTIETIVKNTELDEYKKYGLSALKSIVLAKGLATDVSKMKKPALLELLGVSK